MVDTGFDMGIASPRLIRAHLTFNMATDWLCDTDLRGINVEGITLADNYRGYTGIAKSALIRLVFVQKRPSGGRFCNGIRQCDFLIPSFSMACCH